MLSENLGYDGEIFDSASFFDSLFDPLMAWCAEPSCEAKCTNCNKGCNKGPDPNPGGT